MDSEEIVKIDPMLIKTRASLGRIRETMDGINELASSIDTYGQQQPIVVTKKLELIDGARRIAACMSLGRDVEAVISEAIEDHQLLDLEVEINVRRKNFTPAEELEAIKRLHKNKQMIYGETSVGKSKGWTVEQTADKIGRSRAAVQEDLKLADALENYPELRECKTKAAMKKALGVIEVVERHDDGRIKREELRKKYGNYNLTCEEGREFMKKLVDNSVDILISDVPNTTFLLYQHTAAESYRFCNDTAHAYLFVTPEHFLYIRELFVRCGWSVYDRPIIWIQPDYQKTTGSREQPAAGYEMIMYARMPGAELTHKTKPDWIQCDSAATEDLIRELLRRSVYPGSMLVNPFCHDGRVLAAGLREGMMVKGAEVNKKAYEKSIEYLDETVTELEL